MEDLKPIKNPITLAFKDLVLEQKFSEAYFNKNLTFGRICHFISIFFFGIFALWDALIIAPERSYIWLIVFSIICLMFLSGFTLSHLRTDIYKKYWQPIYAFYVAMTGFGFITISIWPGSDYYNLYAGLLYILIFNFAVIRLRFIWAAPAGIIIVIAYIVGLFIFQNPDFKILANELFMFVGFTLLGMFISYNIELTSRQDFLLNLSLDEARQKTNNLNARLEKMVEERTQQLRKANENLKGTIAREREISAKLAEEEKALHRNLASLRQAEQMALLGYFEIDWRNDSMYCSDGFHRLLGWMDGEIECTYGRLIQQVHTDDVEMLSSHLSNHLNGQEPISIKFRAFNKSGSLLHINATATTIKDDFGQPLVTQGTLQNVTEAVKLQIEHESLEQQLRQAQKMEAIGTLAGGIAHDFNNILAAITGYTEIALENAKAGKALPDILEQILSSASRAAKLVNQILTFSRKMESMLEPVDINNEVAETANLLKNTIPRMIDIQLDLSNQISTIKGDKTQLQQMLLNLAFNARDAMPNGGKLLFRTKVSEVKKDTCLICQNDFSGRFTLLEIADTGEGMDAQTLEKIFDPFFTTKDVGKGTGLGLATVFGILSTHGWHLTVQTSPGQGTCFNIYMPTPDYSLKAALTQDADHEVLGGQETILLVDDEDDILNIASQFLSNGGYTVITAKTGEDALGLYRNIEENLDLVILDLSMPGMGGHQCLKEILALNPYQKVIVATGYFRDGNLQETLSLGDTTLLHKPYTRKDILASVRNTLDS